MTIEQQEIRFAASEINFAPRARFRGQVFGPLYISNDLIPSSITADENASIKPATTCGHGSESSLIRYTEPVGSELQCCCLFKVPNLRIDKLCVI